MGFYPPQGGFTAKLAIFDKKMSTPERVPLKIKEGVQIATLGGTPLGATLRGYPPQKIFALKISGGPKWYRNIIHFIK